MSSEAPPPPHAGNWPALPPLQEWADTWETVHMWTQIVGKIRLALAPWLNHSWGSTLYVTSKGLGTSLIPYQGGGFEITLDFVRNMLRITSTAGEERAFSLKPMTVADFYRKIIAALEALGIRVQIYDRPVEVTVSIPFAEDVEHKSYDADAILRFWMALVQANRVFTFFRAGFVGKSSPSHFFWGAFDLAVTRFSGRRAPKHPGGAPNCADWVMQEAYSHEVASAGFWPGLGVGEAAFYAYAYPEPDGFRTAQVEPASASYDEKLGEYVLPYESVRTARAPDATLLAFLQSTYEAAANLAGWDRGALEQRFEPPP